MIGRKFDMRAELAKCYEELDTVVEVRNGRAWKDFKAMLDDWVSDVDESIMELSNKFEKNKIEILYKTAMRNSWMRLLHAIETTTARLPELDKTIKQYEATLSKAPRG